MVRRICCGLTVAAVWLLILKFMPYAGLIVILGLGILICLIEFGKIAQGAGARIPVVPLAGCGAAWLTSVYFEQPPEVLNALLVGILFCLMMRVLLDKSFEKPLASVATTVLTFLYLPFFLGFFASLVQLAPGTGDYAPGIMLAVFLVAVVKMSDAGAYFLGVTFGKHKMCPRLSPGKSWEGLAGGILFGVLTGYAFYFVAQRFDIAALAAIKGMMLWQILVAAAGLVIVGVLGDLLESLFKRSAGVKDSSAIFPAMGGFLDTFDSLIFTPAAFYFYLKWICG